MEELKNIVGVADDLGSFEILLKVVGALDVGVPDEQKLATALTAPGADLTVFAPTDGAFADLAVLRGFGGDTINTDAVFDFLAVEFSTAELLAVVQYHVVPGAKSATDITNIAATGEGLATLLGSEIGLNDFGMLKLNDLDLTAADPTVAIPNVAASNGIIHAIDKVLLPIDVDGTPDPTLLDLAGTPGFEILAAVVGLLDQDTIDSGDDNLLLGEALADPNQDLTVFAPTNQAFVNLAETLGYTAPDGATDAQVVDGAAAYLVANVDIPTLRAVVEYHVVGGAKNAAEINTLGQSGQDLTTLGGGTIDLSGFDLDAGTTALGDKDLTVTDPNVAIPNLTATNGIIHAIDNVLLPIDVFGDDLNIVDTVIDISGAEGFDDNAGDFDILREAVIAAELDGVLSADDADLTVFGPTDGAFVGLSQALGFGGSDEDGALDYLLDALNLLNQGNGAIPLLDTVLKYHVSAGTQDFSLIANTGEVTTLVPGTDPLVLGPNLTLVDADPEIADPTLLAPDAVDVRASNGVIHAIDGVLLPADLLQSDGSNDVDFIIGGRGREFFSTGKDNDFIDAKGGRDQILSGSGDDVVLAGSGRDFVDAGSGNDVVKGEDGRDRIFAGSGDDMVDGGRGNDWISGGRGNDTLAGGEGDDLLWGSFGRDTFVFEENGGHDTIAFFFKGQDKIDLSAYGIEDFDQIDIDRKGFFRSEIDLGDTEITVNHFFFGLDEGDFIL